MKGRGEKGEPVKESFYYSSNVDILTLSSPEIPPIPKFKTLYFYWLYFTLHFGISSSKTTVYLLAQKSFDILIQLNFFTFMFEWLYNIATRGKEEVIYHYHESTQYLSFLRACIGKNRLVLLAIFVFFSWFWFWWLN